MDKQKSKNEELIVEVKAILTTFGCSENGVVGYLHHEPTHTKIAVYQHVGWFQRLMTVGVLDWNMK